MPTISRFFGIIIRMFYEDHTPPHFHASYGDTDMLISIRPIRILEGNPAPRVRSMILEWAALHQEELLTDWERCQNAQEPLPIPPLD